jgi:hypothetical protein
VGTGEIITTSPEGFYEEIHMSDFDSFIGGLRHLQEHGFTRGVPHQAA